MDNISLLKYYSVGGITKYQSTNKEKGKILIMNIYEILANDLRVTGNLYGQWASGF